ncbi:hypothetical protein L1887_59111 [Cichorium endivia]|nr:hypothetical protein L1887_59111 [Cichorium endivia]
MRMQMRTLHPSLGNRRAGVDQGIVAAVCPSSRGEGGQMPAMRASRDEVERAGSGRSRWSACWLRSCLAVRGAERMHSHGLLQLPALPQLVDARLGILGHGAPSMVYGRPVLIRLVDFGALARPPAPTATPRPAAARPRRRGRAQNRGGWSCSTDTAWLTSPLEVVVLRGAHLAGESGWRREGCASASWLKRDDQKCTSSSFSPLAVRM